MQQDTKSSPSATSSDVQITTEAGFENEGLAARPVYDFPVHTDLLKNPTLTRDKVATLQRVLGNQATQRVIQRELARRKTENAIQRDADTLSPEEAKSLKTKNRAKAFWANQEEQGKLVGDSKTKGVSTLDLSKITPQTFKNTPTLHPIVFELAQKTVDIQQSKADKIIAKTKIENYKLSILKKRATLEGFVAGVLEKCKKNGYANLGQMDDIARGRFEVSREKDMLPIFKELEPEAKEITTPRINAEGVTFYPRYHVIVNNPTGMTFEWQIGTKATTAAYELKRITTPASLRAAAKAVEKDLPEKADLHDIDYAVFGKMLGAKDPATRDAAQHLIPFHKKVALTLQKSGKLGETDPEFVAEVNALCDEATELLQGLVDAGKTDLIVPLLH